MSSQAVIIARMKKRIGAIEGVRLPPRSPAASPAPSPMVNVDPWAPLDTILPGGPILRSPSVWPRVQPYLRLDLIPDLLDLAQTGRLEAALARADPNDPYSLIWADTRQEQHRETQRLEQDLISGAIDMVESDIACINPRCRAKTVRTPRLSQRRGGDEAATMSFRCQTCRQVWTQSAA